MSFLKKTNLGAASTPGIKPTLGAKKLGGGLSTKPKEVELEPVAEPTKAKTLPTAGKKLGGLGTKKLGAAKKPELVQDDSTVLDEAVTKEEPKLPEFAPAPETPKKKLGGKKLGVKAQPKEVELESTPAEIEAQEDLIAESNLGRDEEVVQTEMDEAPAEVQEEKMSPQKKAAETRKKNAEAKKKAAAKTTDETAVIEELAVDESKRVALPEMDTVMRPIVAPTTEDWEQEKQDVLDALNNIKVEQDMTMAQVKNCLADLDELNFEILPKLHDAETMYDGTKQNYDTVKAIAIAKGSGGNAEARKAEGILACKNFVTPSGAVVDLHQYMLLIEERYKFYQKITDGINFKKYSLVNYNNALKVESKNA